MKAKCRRDLIGTSPKTKDKTKKCFKTYFDMGIDKNTFKDKMELISLVREDDKQDDGKFDSLGVHETMMDYV